jgi:hypothetical protein
MSGAGRHEAVRGGGWRAVLRLRRRPARPPAGGGLDPAIAARLDEIDEKADAALTVLKDGFRREGIPLPPCLGGPVPLRLVEDSGGQLPLPALSPGSSARRRRRTSSGRIRRGSGSASGSPPS